MEQTYPQSSPEQPPFMPKNWLIESILVTIFCCLPFGIIGIVFASQVSTKFAAGDYQGALQASRDAGKWTRIGFFIGIAWIVLIVLIVVIFGIGTFSTYSTRYF